MRVGSDREMQIDAHTPTRRARRALGCLALLLALLVPAALAVAAPARSGRARRASCAASRHGRHSSAKHCAKHHSHKPHAGTHKPKKAAPKAPAPKLTPAQCEDASAPARSAGGSWSCEDGSEPFCADGSEPFRPASGSALMCHAATEDDTSGCTSEGECGIELVCEDAEEAVSAPQGCEHGSALEEEPPETDA
jgi:hypothetical protein